MAAGLAFEPEREERELEAYLGPEYDRSALENYQHLLDEEVGTFGDEERLYRNSRAYLYNLTVFAMSGTKLPYLEVLMSHLDPGARVLDYGCGIGSDGLLLLEAGFDVAFADFANPSVDYLRWRLERRGFEAQIFDLDDEVPTGFDAAFAYDVIEHVPRPLVLIGEMERRAEIVQFNLLEFDAHEQELHYRLPINRILVHAARHDLKSYEVFYGTSHLLLYRPQLVSRLAYSRNLAKAASVRAQAAGRSVIGSARTAARRGKQRADRHAGR
jgi:SAM-dependent methyltransferase